MARVEAVDESTSEWIDDPTAALDELGFHRELEKKVLASRGKLLSMTLPQKHFNLVFFGWSWVWYICRNIFVLPTPSGSVVVGSSIICVQLFITTQKHKLIEILILSNCLRIISKISCNYDR